MDEILSIVACTVVGILFTWISERGKRSRASAERKASEAHDTHRELMRCPAPPLSHPQQPVETSMPEEGVRVTSSEPDIPDIPRHAIQSEAPESASARRHRWRQAIIDSEILTRKY